MNVYVVGTSHNFQTGRDAESEDLKAFKNFLHAVCAEKDIRAIAEEMSPEALAESGATESTCEAITKELNVQHRYCDPDRNTRARLNIRQHNDLKMLAFQRDWTEKQLRDNILGEHRKREIIWLEQIRSLHQYPVLFVCGANHVESFGDLLLSEGVDFQVLAADWSPDGLL